MTDTRPTLLLADQDPPVLRELSAYARAHGYQVIEARTGAEAAIAIDRVRPAAIVLELVMPGADGLLRKLRIDRRVSDVPVVIHTAARVDRASISPSRIGRAEVVYKPSRPDALFARLEARTAPVRTRTCVFVVDDHEDTRDMIAERMALAGIHAFKLASGHDALALLRGVLPSVIFTDLTMPDMLGTELARRVRALGVDVPIVAVTGHASFTRGDVFAEVLVKPFDLEHLPDLVHRLAPR